MLAGGGGAGGGREASEESDRLSTIDESVMWEKQVSVCVCVYSNEGAKLCKTAEKS